MNHEGAIVQEDGEISPPGEQYQGVQEQRRESERDWDRNRDRERTRRRTRYFSVINHYRKTKASH